MSREEAMAALMALLKEIEVKGLPETCCSIDREHAKKFEGILKNFASAKREYDRMSIKARQRWREYWPLRNQGKDRISFPFSEQHFRLYKWTV